MAFQNPSLASDATQELRLATTMTGGVSLAIWMAGVTREINLLTQASQWRLKGGDLPASTLTTAAEASLKLYAELIDVLDVVVDVDVLSGTSAGGINAAFLAWARVKGADLGNLRELWLDLGALTDLLREPTDASTPSLLYGDERMFKSLDAEIPTFTHGPFPIQPAAGSNGDLPSTTLYITTTLLNGETSRFTDSFGTQVQDVDRRGVFTFTEKSLTNGDAASALALAARSSASFPAAFEPSF
ncbi:MAG TPA: patatin-like phospholipase family protein, partial [Mycobacterium sp.]